MSPNEAAEIVLSATRPMTRLEVEQLMARVYYAAHDKGRQEGYSLGYDDGFAEGQDV